MNTDMVMTVAPDNSATVSPDASISSLSRDGVRQGVVKTLPFGISSVAFGMAFGVLAGGLAGIGGVGALAMSIAVYSGSAQMAGIDLWTSHAGTIAIWGTALLVSLRYVLLGLTTRSWFVGQPLWITYSLPFLMSDEVWALTHGEFERERRDLGFFLGSGLTMLFGWTGGTAIGLVVGSRVPDPTTYGIDFVATAAFTALIAGMAKRRSQAFPWLSAAVVAIAAERWLPGQWYIMLGALVGVLTGVWSERRGRDVH